MKLTDSAILTKLLPAATRSAVGIWLDGFHRVMTKRADPTISLELWRVTLSRWMCFTTSTSSVFLSDSQLLDLIERHDTSMIGWGCTLKTQNGKKEVWRTMLYLGEVPQIRCTLWSIHPMELDVERYLGRELFDAMLEQGLVDETSVAPQFDLRGTAHGLYCVEKVKVVRKLQPQENTPRAAALISSLAGIYEAIQTELERDSAAEDHILYLPDGNKPVKKFLSSVDEQLLRAWGRERFAELLAPLGVSLEEWLT